MAIKEKVFDKGLGERSREEDLALARDALADVAPRLVELIRTARDPSAVAVGDWGIAEVAFHLSYTTAGELMVARAAAEGPTEGLYVGDDFVAGVADFNQMALDSDPERDVSVLADRIEKIVADFLEATATLQGDEPVAWVGGIVLPTSALACHLLGEYLVHGYDIARAEGRRWSIDPSHAALGFGFLVDFMKLCDPVTRRAFVNQEALAGLRVGYELGFRGYGRAFFTFEDGNVEVAYETNSKVDCHISGDPVAMMLLGFGRLSQTRAALTGRVLAWGRKPWLAFKLPELLRNP